MEWVVHGPSVAWNVKESNMPNDLDFRKIFKKLY